MKLDKALELYREACAKSSQDATTLVPSALLAVVAAAEEEASTSALLEVAETLEPEIERRLDSLQHVLRDQSSWLKTSVTCSFLATLRKRKGA